MYIVSLMIFKFNRTFHQMIRDSKKETNIVTNLFHLFIIQTYHNQNQNKLKDKFAN